MAQESFFWDGIETGHAVSAPYSARAYREVVRRLVLSDENSNGIVKGGLGIMAYKDFGSYIQAQVAPGAACVKGVLYVNDSPVYFNLTKPPSGSYYYGIVLRYFSNKVRLAVIGPSSSGNPVLTQTDTNFEVLVNYIAVPWSGAAIVDKFEKRLSLNDRGKIYHPLRIGGSLVDFDAAGTTVVTSEYPVAMQVGVVRWTGGATNGGNVSVAFPRPFSAKPLACATTYNPDGGGSSKIHVSPTISNISAAGMTVYWMTPGSNLTQIDFNWIAFGPMPNE